MELSDNDINKIALRVATILAAKLREKVEQPEMLTTSEAAKILKITPGRMRQIADKYPHVKTGDNKQSKLLFYRKYITT